MKLVLSYIKLISLILINNLLYAKDIPLHKWMPYNYLDDYINLLFNNSEELEGDKDIKKVKKATIFVCNDSFYTSANLIYNPQEVALAWILIGAKIMNVNMRIIKLYSLLIKKNRICYF